MLPSGTRSKSARATGARAKDARLTGARAKDIRVTGIRPVDADKLPFSGERATDAATSMVWYAIRKDEGSLGSYQPAAASKISELRAKMPHIKAVRFV